MNYRERERNYLEDVRIISLHSVFDFFFKEITAFNKLLSFDC